MVKNNFPDCLSCSILATEEVPPQGVRHGRIGARDRREEAALLRVAVGESSTPVCGRRGRQAGAWRGRGERPRLGGRSAHPPSRPPRAGGGRGGGRWTP